MYEIMKFDFEGSNIRSVLVNDEPWFIGKDVASVLGYQNTRAALSKHVDDEDKKDGVTICDSIGREQKVVVINESGLYALIFGSKLPEAKKFKHWVTSEVLPSIRRTGKYVPATVIDWDVKEFNLKELVSHIVGLSYDIADIYDSLKKDMNSNEVMTNNLKAMSSSLCEAYIALNNEQNRESILPKLPADLKKQVNHLFQYVYDKESINLSMIQAVYQANGYDITIKDLRKYYYTKFRSRDK